MRLHYLSTQKKQKYNDMILNTGVKEFVRARMFV